MTEIDELEKKALFRFFKLCYVTVYVLSIGAVLALSYDSFPHNYVDYWDIHCSDGRRAPTRENSIYPIGGSISPDEDAKARGICARQLSGGGTFIPDEKNYSLVPKYAIRGSYNEVGKILVLGLGIVILLGEFIRRSFLYVVAGKPFF
jgi:hypothetical protein